MQQLVRRVMTLVSRQHVTLTVLLQCVVMVSSMQALVSLAMMETLIMLTDAAQRVLLNKDLIAAQVYVFQSAATVS